MVRWHFDIAASYDETTKNSTIDVKIYHNNTKFRKPVYSNDRDVCCYIQELHEHMPGGASGGMNHHMSFELKKLAQHWHFLDRTGTFTVFGNS